jgi:chemosensory pili system protein ChpC
VTAQVELYSLLIPLRGERLLVPRMCVAEVIAFADTEQREDENAPSWLLGTIEWNGRRLPVVSFDSDEVNQDDTADRRKSTRSRVVVFHALGSEFKLGFYGVLTQGFPQLVRVNADVIALDSENSDSDGHGDSPILCRVRMIHEFPLIPDLQQLEQKLAAMTV